MDETVSSPVEPVRQLPAIQGLIWSYHFEKDGSAKAFVPEALFKITKHKYHFIWLHLDLVDMRACAWCERQIGIALEAKVIFLGSDPHLRLDQFNEVLCGVLSDGAVDHRTASGSPHQLRFMMGKNWLITGRRHPLHSVQLTREHLAAGGRVSSPSALLEVIIETIIDRLRKSVRALTETMDHIEDRVIDHKVREEEPMLGALRRSAVRMHRDLLGYHVIFRRLAQMSSDMNLPTETCETAQRIVQRIDALHGDVHAIQERARLLQDEISSRIATDMNRSLYVLSMLSALLLPPTLIFGLFGINAGGLPLVGNSYGFVITLLAGGLSAVGVYWFLKRTLSGK